MDEKLGGVIAKHCQKELWLTNDEKILLLDGERILKQAGFVNIRLFSNADEAFLEIGSAKPALVITDDTMPGKLNGRTFSESIKKKLHIPVIGTGGWGFGFWIDESGHFTIDDYVMIPYRHDEIVYRIIIQLCRYYSDEL